MAQEGRYIDAMRVLGSNGSADNGDEDALEDLLRWHAERSLPVAPPAEPADLRAFPRSSSPGCSRLQAQHL